MKSARKATATDAVGHSARQAASGAARPARAADAPPGIEWLIDAFDCDPERLADLKLLQETCAEIVLGQRLRVIGDPQWHQFPARSSGATRSPGPGGVTGLYLLAESHLACHTFPENRWATFNLYCCRSRRPWDWEGQLGRQLGAERVVVRSLPRGGDTGNEPPREDFP